jgi:hypothetical protein
MIIIFSNPTLHFDQNYGNIFSGYSFHEENYFKASDKQKIHHIYSIYLETDIHTKSFNQTLS